MLREATWIPLKVILQTGHALVSVVVLAVWTYLLTGKNQYRFQVLPGKKLALDGAFQVDDVQVLGVSF
jgi:hypothetical protein